MTARPSRRTADTQLLRPTEPVYPALPASPRYGDERWDLTAIAGRLSMSERHIDFRTVPDSYVDVVKDVLTLLARPDHPALVRHGVVRRAAPVAPGGLYSAFITQRRIATWSHERGLSGYRDWTQQTADDLLDDVRHGRHHDHDGTGVAPSTARGYVTELKRLRELAPALEGRGLAFMPWGARSAARVAGEDTNAENKTRPLAWETWAPLVAGSWMIVDQFSPDIIEAEKAYRALPRESRGPGGSNAVRIVEQWIDEGGRVPLHTGFSRAKHVERGQLNLALLARALGINDSIFKPRNANFRPHLVARLQAMSAEPHRSQYGGVYTPTAVVSHTDGSCTTWIDEIGTLEAEYLASVLRAACYVVLSALTGMRDSEIQEVSRQSITVHDGLPAIASRQYKGETGWAGAPRGWWAPAPVMRTVEVLQSLSPHPTHLFARSDSPTASGYAPARDIPRLLEFINGDPRTRPGRGAGLGLETVQLTGQGINATTLRRSFAVFASTHPEAELGLGIQLGHAAWRTTTGYTLDGQQALATLLDSDRRSLLRRVAAGFVLGAEPVHGRPADRVLELRAQVVTDPDRADRIVDSLAERLHLGTANDCVFEPNLAACGPTGPHLGDHACAGSDCHNALHTREHVPVLRAHLERIDTYLAKGGHEALTARMRDERIRVARLLRALTQDFEEEPA